MSFGTVYEEPPSVGLFVPAVILGVVCGILGGIQNKIHNWLYLFRKFHVTHNWVRVIEVVIFSLANTSICFWTPFFISE